MNNNNNNKRTIVGIGLELKPMAYQSGLEGVSMLSSMVIRPDVGLNDQLSAHSTIVTSWSHSSRPLNCCCCCGWSCGDWLVTATFASELDELCNLQAKQSTSKKTGDVIAPRSLSLSLFLSHKLTHSLSQSLLLGYFSSKI